jgi:hypothetical protein
LAKRRVELAGAGAHEGSLRPVLAKYSLPFLDHLLTNAAVMAIMCYALFTTTSGHNPTLVVTVPIVFYGIMHYKRMVLVLSVGEEAEKLLLKDCRLQAAVALWLLTYFAVVHYDLRFIEGR